MVISIVIIIILSVVTINVVFGENGLVKRAEEAKFESDKEEAREQIELVLGAAYIEKVTKKPGYNDNEYLDNYVKGKLPGVVIEQEEIALNGFEFELNRSVPELGKYIGQSTGPAIKEIKETGTTTNSISIEVVTVRAEGATYTYSYKKNDEGEEKWKEASSGKDNTYTFNDLEANVIYNIKVKVETKNGKVEEVVNITTGDMPTGTIKFGDVSWAGDGTASVNITTEAIGYTLQYQKNGIAEDAWINTTSGSEISGLSHGDKVNARLWDGKNGTEPATTNIRDELEPTVSSIETGTITENSIEVTVTASDKESGLAQENTYKYYINGEAEPRDTSTNNNYTFTGLTAETEYTIKVETFDKAGNMGGNTVKATTLKDPNSIESRLKEGDYVTYPSAKGDLNCIVLYDNTSEYGVQLITSTCVGSDITLGKDFDFNGNKTVYNNAVGKLNNAAGAYNNSTYSTRARCVGSHPTNTSDTTTYFTSSESYMSSYNGQFKNGDENYDIDYKKMQAIRGGIHNIGKNYWLASRCVESDSKGSGFIVRYLYISGALADNSMCSMNSGGGTGAVSYSNGLRPVFILKSGIKVTGGNGESGTPYTLGV